MQLFSGKNTSLFSWATRALTPRPNFEQYANHMHTIRKLEFQKMEFKDSDLVKLRSFPRLEELTISHSKISSMKKLLKSARKLKKLNLELNDIKKLPSSELAKLTDLEELRLGGNCLEKFPKSLFSLPNLKFLSVASNYIKKLPKEISSMQLLQVLYVTDNMLEKLPSEIGQLENLEVLDAGFNAIESIPIEIQNLKKLHGLNLSSNRITELPPEMACLTSIEKLYLPDNYIREIPAEFGDLKTLKKLHLESNRIHNLPSTMAKLRETLQELNLHKNPLKLDGTEFSFGFFALDGIFGDRLKYGLKPGFRNRMPRITIIPKEKVFEDLKAQDIHWNVPVLKTLINNPIPEGKLSKRELLDKWRENFNRFAGKEDGPLIVNYIQTPFDPERRYDLWKMNPHLVDMTIDLIEAVFNAFQLIVDNVNISPKVKEEILESNINGIAVGIKHCPDRQYAELYFAYKIVMDYLATQKTTLNEFIRHFIAVRKEGTFDFVFTPDNTQNVHALNYWKNKLRNELGFEYIFDTGMGTYYEDKFQDRPGNALQAFFEAFTPASVVKELAIEINKNKDLLQEVADYAIRTKMPFAVRKRFFEVGALGIIDLKAVKVDFVYYYLIQENILELAEGMRLNL